MFRFIDSPESASTESRAASELESSLLVCGPSGKPHIQAHLIAGNAPRSPVGRGRSILYNSNPPAIAARSLGEMKYRLAIDSDKYCQLARPSRHATQDLLCCKTTSMSLAHDIHLSRINDSVSSDTRMRRIFLCVRKLLIQSRIAEIEMHNALELARTSYDVVVSAKMSRLLLWHESTIRMLEARYETLGAFATMTYEKAATTYESYRCRTATLPSLLDLRKTWEEVNIYSIKTTFLWEFFSWTAADYIKMCQKIYEVQSARTVRPWNVAVGSIQSRYFRP